LRWTALVGVLLLESCSGVQSALQPGGRAAEQIADLFWWMAGGAAVVWLAVMSVSVYAIFVRPEPHRYVTANNLIVGGGIVFPTLVLALLLGYGLTMIPELVAPAPAGSRVIEITGEQFWWRVRYQMPDGSPVELANEVRLPNGQPAQFLLQSPDVIHSFWIPSIAGKMDLIPGRVTRLALEPTKTGVFRGACAEYCGASHALMNFYAVVQEQSEFEGWLQRQAAPARPPDSSAGQRGHDLFLSNGCGACHTIRGTPANGFVGPDLTHVGSRVSLAAGIMPNDVEAFLRWIAGTENIKPGVHMPAFRMLPPSDLLAIATYLDGLE
jgi:cytochrome c oxidase subunit 2